MYKDKQGPTPDLWENILWGLRKDLSQATCAKLNPKVDTIVKYLSLTDGKCILISVTLKCQFLSHTF